MNKHQLPIRFSVESLSRKLFLLILCLLLSFKTLSQSFKDNPTQIKEIPPSPGMWEFQKVIDYPVSMHTGLANITIPIYTIKQGELQVPISINYHASGIKVDQKATWVGLGWNLSAGGAITRTIRGSNDEGSRGYINGGYKAQGSFDPASSNNYYATEEMIEGLIDTEPDIFYYEFMGYSGKFLFNPSASPETATIALIPHNDLKITPIFGSGFNSIVITTPDGIKAEFSLAESSSEYRSGLLGGRNLTANSTWHLSKITAINGIDTITFEYDLVNNGTGSAGEPGIVTDSKVINYTDPCIPTQYSITPSSYSPGVVYFGVKRIKKINFSNGYISFQSSSGARLDDPSNHDLRLDAIKIYSSLNGINTLIKSHELNYGYFGNYAANAPVPSYTARLKLEKIYEVGKNGIKNNPYEFFYNGTVQMPSRYSKSQDYWGYYNGKGNASLAPSLQYEVTTGNMITLGDANREIDTNFTKTGMIEKIVYPTKGYTNFSFEINTATIMEGGVPKQYFTGGLRVKQIIHDADNSGKWQKSYEYLQSENNALSSGVYNGSNYIKPNDFKVGRSYYYAAQQSGSCTPSDYPVLYQKQSVTVYSNPQITKNFANTFYSTVKEYNGSTSAYSGFKIFRYSTTKDVLYQGTGPISFMIDRSWDRGQLISEETYKNGDIYNPVQKVTNEYENISKQLGVPGFKPGTRFDVESLGFLPPENQGSDSYSFRSQQYFLVYYEEPVFWKRLKSSTAINDGITVKKDFYYNGNNHTNETGISTIDSDGHITETKIYYPDDVLNVNSLPGEILTDPDYNAINVLKSQNRKNIPIQTDNKDNGQLLSTRTIYRDWKASANSVVRIVEPQFIKTLKGVYHATTNPYQLRTTFYDYDTYGNPLEVGQSSGQHTSYLWGYGNQFPVAKVDNATYSQLTGTGIVLSTINSASTNDQTMRNELNKLRTLSNSFATTYTYAPLIGLTSETDSKGYTIYYEYDDFNRLEYIRDAEGKILSKHEYHYKGQ